MEASQFDATIHNKCGHVEPPSREIILTSIQRIAFSSAIATVLAVAPFAAQAGSYATATVGELGFQLIDLDNGDAVAPFYALNLGSNANSGSGPGYATPYGSSVSVSATDTSLGWSDSASKARDRMFFQIALDAASGNAQASGEVSANAVTASGSAAGKGTSFNASAVTGLNTNGYYYNSIYAIDLSPRSVLVVTARADAVAWAGNGQCVSNSYYSSSCGSESATATAGMNLSYNYYGTGISASYSFNDSVSASASVSSTGGYQYDPRTGYGSYVYTPTPDQLRTSGRLLTAVFTNSSDQVQRATLGLSATVSGNATTAIPIPEASTTAMFALGLLGLVGVARRRA